MPVTLDAMYVPVVEYRYGFPLSASMDINTRDEPDVGLNDVRLDVPVFPRYFHWPLYNTEVGFM